MLSKLMKFGINKNLFFSSNFARYFVKKAKDFYRFLKRNFRSSTKFESIIN